MFLMVAIEATIQLYLLMWVATVAIGIALVAYSLKHIQK